jgi:ABC-type phosphate transport system permease subunit
VQQAQPPQDSFLVTVVPATPAPERTVADVIIGSLGIVLVLTMVAIVLGTVFAGIRLAWLRRFPPAGDHMPPVKPNGASLPPTPPAR